MPDSPTPTLDPRTTIVLAMDFQPGIIPRLPEGEQVLAAASRALQIARAHGAHVGYVRVGLTPEEFAAMPEHAPMKARLPADLGPMHADAAETQVDERIAPQDGDLVVRKPRVGAFAAPDFEPGLRERGIITLVLTGLSTSGVVLSTLRAAADRDYRVIVLADAVGDFKPDAHRVLLADVFPNQALVTTVDELDGLFAS
jgi:nicotinamidase-related amidase